VRVWGLGYNGSAEYVFLCDSKETPFKFDLFPTGETITLKFESVNQNGFGNFATAPTAQVLLDGQTSAPATPSNVAAVKNANTAGKVFVSWSEGLEADIDGYQVARRTDDNAPTSADIIAPNVFAGGVEATAKASYIDIPGAGSANYRYRVRAVNRSGLKSAWSSAASIQALAPDGTTDAAVPSAPTVDDIVGFGTDDGEIRVFGGGGVIVNGVMYAPGFAVVDHGTISAGWSGSFVAANNMKGVFAATLTFVHYSNSARTTDEVTTKVTIPFLPEQASGQMKIPLNNRYLKTVSAHLTNYYGDGAESSVDTQSSGFWTGTHAEDNRPPTTNFDPAVQDYGARTLIGRSTGNLTLSTNSASAVVESDRHLDIINSKGLRIANTEVISSGRVVKAASLEVGGNGVIDASRNVDANSLKIGGSTKINSSGQWVLPLVNSGGGTHIETDGDCNFNVYKTQGTPGVSGSFTTVDGKTVTVTRGIVTDIV